MIVLTCMVLSDHMMPGEAISFLSHMTAIQHKGGLLPGFHDLQKKNLPDLFLSSILVNFQSNTHNKDHQGIFQMTVKQI